ncbi:DUF3326 domain-containing protein [bacterium]|nr:DUF3326 domain-containing protein [bacterium]
MKKGAFIIPTGIGASIGGFAGDASKWARKIAKKCKLIVNPNVVNAACFSGITENMLYVEGYTLDEFFKGNCFLEEAKENKIGVVFDKSISSEVLNVHINTINAVKTVYDIDIVGYEITQEDVGVEFFIDESGISTGNVKNLLTIKDACNKLITKGAEAVAIVCRFPDEQGDDYANGIGVDPVGGVEAIISHFISKELKIPCAHAPAFDDICITTNLVDSRCSAEYITPTFLPCILLGLSQAPKISFKKGINIKDLDFVVLPADALGGIPALEAKKNNIKIYAIEENKTVLNINQENFLQKCDIIKTYKELLELI